MTLKSTLRFGIYEGLTVERIIAIGKRQYLAHIYFDIAGITFTDDVLTILGIKENYRFNKPGTNKDLSKKHFIRIKPRGLEGYIKHRIRKRKSNATIQTREELQCKKSVLQAYNHGHK